MEGRPLADSSPLEIWRVPAIEKVFPDEPAPREPPAAGSFAAARNEWESLQGAVRSPQALQGARVPWRGYRS